MDFPHKLHYEARMPHIVVEYSKSLHNQAQENHLLQELRNTVIASDLFSPDAVKARSIAYEDYLLDEAYDSFLHIDISILEGRALEARKALLESVYAVARGLIPFADTISVNIHEMMRETYKKS